ncbi:diacylglycerol kinase [gut metagenome]|uniref:Diacylglycerol kinase n=1 Tax=gut metagenome TaxID=749906 RepID=J9D1A9_9ZZZZ
MQTNHSDSAENLKGKQGLQRLFNATKYSFKGFKAAFRHEAAFREETLLALVLIPLALFLELPAVETLLLIGSVLLLMLVEILNSAIEAVVDRIGPELHPLSGRAKDMGSAAVFLAMTILGLTWGLLAGPALWNLLFS